MSSTPRTRRALRLVTAGVGLSLATTGLAAVTSSPASAADPVSVNIVGINDFHGRIARNGQEAGAASLTTAINELRAAEPNTVFAAAGDLIGASTFDSFIANDKPTIDVLNEAGLEVSAAGNHEFDKGYDDLVNRVLAPESEANPDGGAEWEYLAANVKMRSNGSDALDPTWVKTFGEGDSAVEVGFVGAVTEHLPELVAPSGIADIQVTDVVTAVNEEAAALKADGVDLVVMLVHEGAPTTTCADMDDDPASDFGSIVTGASADVDAIVSGHTHLAYDCKFPVAGWNDRAVKERPVVSAGQYGYNLNQLTYSVDPETGDALSLETEIVPLTTCTAGCGGSSPTWVANYDPDPATAEIVADAVEEANVLGAVELGTIGGEFRRAKANGIVNGNPALVENRGGESTVGNLVAEVQRWATSTPEAGSAEIAFMNPGGLRADMLGNAGEGYPAPLTYRQAANVQPFANTLVNMSLTGAQIEKALEQQWQPTGASRPYLALGTSDGFEYTYDPTAEAGSRILSMTLDGDPIAAAETFSVTVNSFLASGGDNFGVFAEGTGRRDTGKVDLQAMVDYMDEFGEELPVEYDQHSVGVDFAEGTPSVLKPGDTVAFDLSSLSFTNATDVKDEEVTVSFDGGVLGTFPVDSSLPAAEAPAAERLNDEVGKASVSVKIPAYVGSPDSLVVTGAATGTSVDVPVETKALKGAAKVKATAKPKKLVVGKTKAKVKVQVSTMGEDATGKVKVTAGGKTYTKTLKSGVATFTLKPFGSAGKKKVTVKYLGNDLTKAASDKLTLKVKKAKKNKKN